MIMTGSPKKQKKDTPAKKKKAFETALIRDSKKRGCPKDNLFLIN